MYFYSFVKANRKQKELISVKSIQRGKNFQLHSNTSIPGKGNTIYSWNMEKVIHTSCFPERWEWRFSLSQLPAAEVLTHNLLSICHFPFPRLWLYSWRNKAAGMGDLFLCSAAVRSDQNTNASLFPPHSRTPGYVAHLPYWDLSSGEQDLTLTQVCNLRDALSLWHTTDAQ